MVGERKINYAASKLQPSAIAPQPLEIRVAAPAEEETTAKTAPKKKAEKLAPKRGRGRPAGSKNKTIKMKKTTNTKKATAKKPSKKTTAKAAPKSKTQSTASNEPFAQGNDMMKAALESGNMTAEIAKNLTEEAVQFANKSFSENVELSKEFFNCRTISDMFEIQNKIMKQNLDNFFKQSSKMSEMMFKAASETSAPLNSSLTSTADSFTTAADEWKKKFAA